MKTKCKDTALLCLVPIKQVSQKILFVKKQYFVKLELISLGLNPQVIRVNDVATLSRVRSFFPHKN